MSAASHRAHLTALLLGTFLLACTPTPEGPGDGGDGGAPPVEGAVVRHSFGTYALKPFEEVLPCISWTLQNEEPLYVQAATLSNDGFYHHSNWTVVPEDMYPGPDGFWDCDARGFNQVTAAIAGTVLMAQSTQAVEERQVFPPGVVVVIPPHHKLVAGAHLLNTSAIAVESELRMALEIIHPRHVKAILAPFHLDNRALEIPPQTESRFRLRCDLREAFEQVAGEPLHMRIRYVLPHFHYKANFWRLEILGGPRDGEVIHELHGFAADPGGIAFDPPIELEGAHGLTMTCGYLNDSDQTLVWGIGENEMCEMLGLAESPVLMDAGAQRRSDNRVVGYEGGVLMNEAPCSAVAIEPSEAQVLPSEAERAGPLYVPPSDDPSVDPTPECRDSDPAAAPLEPASLSTLRETIFRPRCSFNACHGGTRPAAGLDLAAEDLHGELLGHIVQAKTARPLVAPGDPEGSLLYQLVSQCDPRDEAGRSLPNMPLNSPRLLPDALVATLRAWIEAGAPND
ncbi:MAG: hypothetical protein D6729_13905 [Deltaproteobacteria bacterium]|nr:MAG: hypothetical protein D6729_13905 [Deltaproteobacteria bacterium]